MKLTMKNYKGYNKNPYCNAHYPTTKFTAIADTPENIRLAKQSKQQSQVEYHKKFEEDRGQYTAVADDPETERAKRAMAIQSDVVYTKHHNPAMDQPSRPPVHQDVRDSYPAPEPVRSHAVPPPVPAPQSSQPRYRALYDYNAADDDEVSIVEGDVIIEANIVDSGWMEGKNQRTGKFGMLPSNYVEQV